MNQKNVISYILMMWLIISTLGENCDDIICSNIFDEVCGVAELNDGTRIKLIYQNICYMKKAACEQESFVDVYQVDLEFCESTLRKNTSKSDENQDEGRRLADFTIVGAHQVCNHSCPTYCTDAYQPACAQIWKRNMRSSRSRVMINHCHIDLFSCTTGFNVTIQPLGKCYKNPSSLLFMQNVAVMKSLRLLDEEHLRRRRANVDVSDDRSEGSHKINLKDVVRRIYDKYSSSLEQDES